MDITPLYKNFSQPWLQERTIYLCCAGSHAYGTNTPESDNDYRGIVVPPKEYILGFVHRFEQAESLSPADIVLHDIRKFMNLACEGNPGFLEMLFCDDEHVLHTEVAGRVLRMSRRDFLSKNIGRRINGFAYSQLCRFEAIHANGGRNAKPAMHCIRLLRMGVELFTTGQLNVRRLDAEELLAVKAWPLDKVQLEARRLMDELEAAVEASSLPQAPPKAELDQICQRIVKSLL